VRRLARNCRPPHRSKRCLVSRTTPSERWRTELDPERRENVAQRLSSLAKAVAGVARPGLRGHRILRRVLVGGRHLRTSRAIGFHESMVKATLAASSRGMTARPARKSSSVEGRAKATASSRERGRGDRGVRGLVGSRRRGKKTPTLGFPSTVRGE